MENARRFALVVVTVPDRTTARRMAKLILEARLAACANLVPEVESHYWWKGKLEQSREVLMLLKTPTSKLVELEEKILAHHPYDTPEMIALTLGKGTRRYLEWLTASTSAENQPRRRRSSKAATQIS